MPKAHGVMDNSVYKFIFSNIVPINEHYWLWCLYAWRWLDLYTLSATSVLLYQLLWWATHPLDAVLFLTIIVYAWRSLTMQNYLILEVVNNTWPQVALNSLVVSCINFSYTLRVSLVLVYDVFFRSRYSLTVVHGMPCIPSLTLLINNVGCWTERGCLQLS